MSYFRGQNAIANFELKPGSHIHFMGICGTAMGGLAGLLKNLGFRITGSDQNVYPPMSTQLTKLGITLLEGYKKENLIPHPDLVIVGNVMTRKHEEVQALLDSNIVYTHLPFAIGSYVIGNCESLVVSGTHGKTTTTAMLSFVAQCCGLEPGFLIGGKPIDFSVSFRLPEKNTFIIEGDEYDTAFFAKKPKFIFYKPTHVILTSVEFDHADIYKDLNAVETSFRELTQLATRTIVAAYDDSGVRRVLAESLLKTNAKVIGYGIHSGDYLAKNISHSTLQTTFDVYFQNEKRATVSLQLFGRYNIMNALAVFALASQLGWPQEKVLEGLKNFKGVKRRQEIIGTPRGITVIEDFAHHPTAVKLTLESINERFKSHQVFAVFEPRSATSRRKIFQKEYVEAFKGKSEILISKPYNQTNIEEADRFSVDELVSDLRGQGVSAQSFTEVDSIVQYIAKKAQSGDAVLIMSNGGFDNIYEKVLKTLQDR